MSKGWFAVVLTPLFLIASSGAQAVNITINDACGKSYGLSSLGSTSVSSSGDLTLTQATSTLYTAGIGHCDSPASDGKPVCTLSASRTLVGRNVPVTFFAKCTSSPTSYTWIEPSNAPPSTPADPDLTNQVTVSFPNDGVYTYSVRGTNAVGAGTYSPQLSILVGEPGSVPACLASASPAVINRDSSSTLQAVCHPAATSFEWTNETNAPVIANEFAEAVFNTAGTFTYKVRGTNAAGTGEYASATVTVRTPPTGEPVIRGVSSTVSASTINVPAGTASTDWLVFYVLTTSTTAPTVSDWTLYASYTTSGGSPRYAYVYGRPAGSTTSVTLASGYRGSALMILSCQGATGMAVGAFSESTAGASSIALNPITPTHVKSLVLGVVADADATYPTPPVDFATRAQAAPSFARVNVAEKAYQSTSSTGSPSWTQATTAPAHGVLIEIKP